MELGWPLPKRRQHLKDVQAEKTDKTHPIPFQGKMQYLPVYLVPIGLPLYRLENGRTTGRQAEYLAAHPDLPSDFFRVDGESAEAQKAQHQLLVKLTRERKNLFREFEKKTPQTEPLILSSTGYVVNGNRRLSTWRELYATDPSKYAHLRNINVVILPYVDEREIDRTEAELQLKEDLKADYSWTSTALMIREKMQRYKYKEDELASIYGRDKKELTEIIDCLDYAIQYLESRDMPNKFSAVDDKEYAFIQICKSRRKMKGSEADKELFEKASFCLADEAGEGKRIYSEIPKIADHIDAISDGLASEFEIDAAQPEDKSARLVDTLSEKANFERARLTIRDTIEAVVSQKREKRKKDYVASLVTRAKAALADAKDSIEGQSSKKGVVQTLDDIETLIAELRAWAASDE